MRRRRFLVLLAAAALSAACGEPEPATTFVVSDQPSRMRRTPEQIRRVAVAQECEAGNDDACLRHAEMLIRGDGGLANQPQALTVLETSCDRGHEESCALVGIQRRRVEAQRRRREDLARAAGPRS